jgi:hypothetical protein
LFDRDTVASVGLLPARSPSALPFVDANPSVRVFRHALALDEISGVDSELPGRTEWT